MNKREQWKNPDKSVNPLAVTRKLCEMLVKEDFTVHWYRAQSGSCYIKIDGGLLGSARVSTHRGKKKYFYRYNVETKRDYYCETFANNNIQMFFGPHDLEFMVEQIKSERRQKMRKYGIGGYYDAYDAALQKAETARKSEIGFWKNAKRYIPTDVEAVIYDTGRA